MTDIAATEIFHFVHHRMKLIYDICRLREMPPADDFAPKIVIINIAPDISKDKLTPFHIVLLSCCIEELKRKGYFVRVRIENKQLRDFLHNDMNFTEYWKGSKTDHIDSPDPARLNLWRAVEGKADEYEISIHQYFSKKFPGIDFFMLKTCLSELYFNIFDHSSANGVAFSYIYYDEDEGMIHIAICDFGKGIATTMRTAFPNITSDPEALKKSLERGISARTHLHNAGFGLDNVISTLSDGSILRIISNKAFLTCVKKDGEVETKSTEFPFELKGTLIYFDLPISGFEEEEINDGYTF